MGMKKIFLFLLIIAGIFSVNAFSEQVAVKFKKGRKPFAEISAAKQSNYIKQLDIYIFQTNETVTKQEIIKKYAESAEYIESEIVYKLHYIPFSYPDDTLYSAGELWHINDVKLDSAWNSTNTFISGTSTDTSEVIIAVADSGVYSGHEDLSGRIIEGYNAINNSNTVYDENGHGTFVSGIICANANNSIGVAGAAMNARLMPIKILGYGEVINYTYAAKGIVEAADMGAKVINMSFGGPISSLIKDACDYALSKGCILVASAGNEYGEVKSYPAAFPGVIAVGGTGKDGSKSDFSNYGDWVHFAAPAGDITKDEYIRSTKKDGTYGMGEGTSFSAPIVSAAAAILCAGGSTQYDVVSRLAATCDKTGPDPYPTMTTLGTRNEMLGYGRINILRALKTLIEPKALSITANFNSISMTWAAPEETDIDFEGYIMYRANNSNDFYRLNETPVITPEFTDSLVSSGTEYIYKVKGIYKSGIETKASSSINCIAKGHTPTVTMTITPTPTFTITPTPYRDEQYLVNSVCRPGSGLYMEIKGICKLEDPDIRIYDIQGRLIEKVSLSNCSGITWKASNVSSGIYIVIIRAKNFNQKFKFAVIK